MEFLDYVEIILFFLYVFVGTKAYVWCRYHLFGVRMEFTGDLGWFYIGRMTWGVLLGWVFIPLMIIGKLLGK